MSDSPKTDSESDADQDLRDVFKLMYNDEEEDWTVFDEDHPPMDALVPDLEAEPIDVGEDEYLSQTYSRKRFRIQLDALIPSPSLKKRRIFPQASREVYHPSTTVLPPLPSLSSYEPFSPLSFLARLRTFHPSIYSPFHPVSISPRRLTLNGWYCSGKDGLECGSCGARWGVVGLEEIRDIRIKEEIGRRLREGLSARHKMGCPWKVLSCPDGMMGKLRNFLHTPIANNIAQLAQSLASIPRIQLKSRLSDKQRNQLLHALSRYIPEPTVDVGELAFFGWSPHPISEEIVQCRICQRRLGLWAFRSDSEIVTGEAKTAGLDPVGEHLTWCPLAVEGWWAECALLRGGRGYVGDVSVSKGVKRRKWLITAGPK